MTSQVKKVLTAKNHETLKVVNSGSLFFIIFISLGIRAFTRDGPNVLQPGERFSIRFYHEMLPFLSPQLISSERLVNVTLEDMMVLLTSSYPRFSEFSRPLCEILTVNLFEFCKF